MSDDPPTRSRASPEDISAEKPDDPPESYEYALVESGGEMDVFELCAREKHRCIKIDGSFHCVDCDHTAPIPEEGVQMTFGGDS